MTGCSQLLGLDPTTFAPQDAPIDAPSVCDDLPACVPMAGERVVCGRIVGAGSQVGVPLRVASPTGNACDPSDSEGRCGLTVEVMPMSSLFSSGSSTPATVDDCGRFTGTIDPSIDDIAVKLSGGNFQNSASLINGLADGEGSQVTPAYAITSDTQATWSAQVGSADVSTGYLMKFTDTTGDPIAGVGAANDDGAVYTNAPGTTPWAAYFSDEFGTFGSGSTSGSAGTAFAVPPSGTIRLEGFRTGHARCGRDGLQVLPGFVIFVLEVDC